MARGRGRGARNQGAIFEASIDVMHNYPVPPTLINGVYTFVGNEMSFRVHSETMPQPVNQNLIQPNMMMQQNMTMMQQMSMQQNPLIAQNFNMQTMGTEGNEAFLQQPISFIQQANITLVGNKTKPSNTCCFTMTIIAGSLCIIPLCFMCCMWWKKITFPMYELTVDAYNYLANFISKNPNMNNLTLTVVDNTFNAQKARIIYEALSRSRITGFTFTNRALPCNFQYNEADDFRTNMTPIKSSPNITSSITWGDMII